MDKDKRIKAELKKLNDIFKDLDGNKKSTVEKLVQNAAFMSVTLEELQEAIKDKGFVEKYQNGPTQHGYKKTNEIEIYNVMIKNYHAIIKQLVDLCPTYKKGSKLQELMNDMD